MDVTQALQPKSDQLSAEDFTATGPRTVTITSAEVRNGEEQPIRVYTDAYGKGRPLKPSKTVGRIMARLWGKDTDNWAGHSVTLYTDPSVRFGGQQVGGIRISHATGIDKPLTVALTETRGKKAIHTIQPLTQADAAPAPSISERIDAIATPQQARELWASLNAAGELTEPISDAIKAKADETETADQ